MARNAALINQFATPGLGSLLAGRIASGVGQLLVALVGFAFFLGWFGATMKDFYGLMAEDYAEPVSHRAWLVWGLVVFAIAWLWSLVTSLQLLRAAKPPPPEIQNQPPLLPK